LEIGYAVHAQLTVIEVLIGAAIASAAANIGRDDHDAPRQHILDVSPEVRLPLGFGATMYDDHHRITIRAGCTFRLVDEIRDFQTIETCDARYRGFHKGWQFHLSLRHVRQARENTAFNIAAPDIARHRGAFHWHDQRRAVRRPRHRS